jgi:endogenous inhibitor of DNA gyrase (YacG/DUF329 family)
MTYDIKCPVCGKLFQIDTASPGRPRHFCSKTCANIEKFYSFAMDKLEKIPMTKEARREWKGRLFTDRNLVFREG